MQNRRSRSLRWAMPLAIVMATRLLPASKPAGEALPVPEVPVSAELLGDRRTVAPGETFSLGVLLTIGKGWHVYWRNPGDAGLATRVVFRLPAGFRAGPLRWPTPETFRQAGDLVGYGYAGRVLLWADVTVPKTLPPTGHVDVSAEVAYLACNEQCVPGQATVKLRLPVARRGVQANAERFAAWRGRLPRAAADADELASVAVSGRIPPGAATGRFTVLLRWRRPPVAVEWCPAAGSDLVVEKVLIRTRGRETRVRFSAERAGGSATGSVLETVAVHVDGRGARRGVLVPIALEGIPVKATTRPSIPGRSPEQRRQP